jgi:hypothetical protein
MQLESLTHPDDNPELVRKACFEVGWKLRSPNSWEYINIWTQESDVVTIPELIKAIQAKRELNPKVVSINKFTSREA